ncbi:integral membrane protein [Drechmeria coniospora]|uniref:Integral membrane protein n=1 Tax=Drechmeria coniospora TaxID=98403 RepID=A0A151GUH0_DRECN|nr:integral membrane protein [Drechmeria coniospora]KYK60755.1 integral membrane protein [Drechmeria coniospora]ODA83446.1 hypothetical protein RJ55_01960 [Drechmeria coniospora]
MPRRRRPPRAGALSELQPLKIASQIAMLQAAFYVAAIVLMILTALVAGISISPDLVFGWETIRGDTTTGWLLAFVWVLNGGLCMTVALVILIGRSKLVPDFALTMHFVHLALTTVYSRSLPRHSMWWATMLGSSALSVALGIWGCRYRELQPVFFGGGRILGSGTTAVPTSSTSMDNGNKGQSGDEEDDALLDGDEEMAFSRGRGHRRARRSVGEYEMVQMKQAKD